MSAAVIVATLGLILGFASLYLGFKLQKINQKRVKTSIK